MNKRLLALAVVVVMAVSLFAGCAGGGGTIKIGAIQPISGKISEYGTQSRDAINLAIKEINAKGGVLGKKVEVFVEDDEANPEKTVNAFNKLVTQQKVIGIIGALTSNSSLAINKLAQERKIVMISPSSTNAAVTEAGDYVFRASFIDPFQGTVNAKFAFDNLKAKKAAVIFDNTNDYSKGLKDSFIAKFKELGGEVTAEESYSSTDKDFAAQLTKIKGTNPEILFIPDYYNMVALIAKQARNQGITATFLGGDGWEAIAQNAGDEVVGSYYSNHYSSGANDPEVKAFVAAFQAEYKLPADKKPNALAALAYDATYILLEAIQRAGSTDTSKIKVEMAKTDRKFVTGKIKYNEKRDAVKSAVMIKVDKGADGKLTEVFDSIVNP